MALLSTSSSGEQDALTTPWVIQGGGSRVGLLVGLDRHFGPHYICGPAVTCACAPDDNLALHVALYRASPGTVLVCDGGATSRTGLFGELMATEAVSRGVAGLVVSGTVRDVADLERLGFLVVCRGTAPGQASKSQVVSVGEPVVVGGVLISPGDQIVSDRDGTVVVPERDWIEVAAAARQLALQERGVLNRLGKGERLAHIGDMDPDNRFGLQDTRGLG